MGQRRRHCSAPPRPAVSQLSAGVRYPFFRGPAWSGGGRRGAPPPGEPNARGGAVMSRASISGSAIVLGACLLALLAAPSARAQQGEGEKTRMSAAELKEWISKRTDRGAGGGAGG